MHDSAHFLAAVLLRGIDDRREFVGAAEKIARENQVLRVKSAVLVTVEEGSHADRQRDGRKKIAVEALAADHVQRLVTNVDLSYSDEAECAAVRKSFTLQKCRAVLGRGRCFLVSETSRPLRRRNDGAIGFQELEKIKLMCLRLRRSIRDIDGAISALAEIERHPCCALTAGDAVDPPGDFVPATLKLLAELPDEGFRACVVGGFEDLLCPQRHHVSDRHHCSDDDEGKRREQPLAKAHGRTSGRERETSQMSPNFQSPTGEAPQLRTRS
ncbi:MAG: hypothetical protein ACXWCW_31800, partial [Burkholderiales bacterium]